MLLIASSQGAISTVESLLKEKIDVNTQDTHKWTALHNAASNNKEEITDLLIDAGAEVNTQNEDGDTALHIGCYEARKGIVQRMLDAHADVNIQNKRGNTALHNIVKYYFPWNRQNEEGCKLKHQNNEDIIKLLISGNADVNKHDNAGRTSLHFASWCGKVDAMQLLIDANAGVNITDSYDRTPLFHGTLRGQFSADLEKTVTTLLKAKGNINHQDKDGMTVLHHASEDGDVDCVKILLAENADTSILDKVGQTPWEKTTANDIHDVFQHDKYLKHRTTILCLYHRIGIPLELALYIWKLV